MTREEAIDVLENGSWWDDLNPYKEQEELHDAIDFAIAALREQEKLENPKTLTLDELRKMDGEPVFLEDLVHKSDPKVPDLWGGWIVFTSHNMNGLFPRGGGFFSNNGYGKTWLAYRSKPKEGA